MKLSARLSALVLAPAFGVACAHTTPAPRPTVVISNAQAIADEMEKAIGAFIRNIQVPDGARVALMSLDGAEVAPGNVVSSVYDHLAIALAKERVTVVERDPQGIHASAQESWDPKIPFSVAPAGKSKGASAPAGGPSGASRAAAMTFGATVTPTWVTKDGDRVATSQSSATHILAFRVLSYGATLTPNEDASLVDRRIRIDLVLRLIRTEDGIVTWSDRLTHETVEMHRSRYVPRLLSSVMEFRPLVTMTVDEDAATEPALVDASRAAAATVGPVSVMVRSDPVVTAAAGAAAVPAKPGAGAPAKPSRGFWSSLFGD
jgi:hypothetical protein